MLDPFLGMIKLYPYNFTPKGWLLCDGASLPVNSYQALYSLIGNKFGGNNVNFNLPNLMQAAPKTSDGQKMAYYICINGIYPTRP